MRSFSLADWRVKSTINRHIPGAKRIAEGSFSVIFDDGDPDTVVKVFTCKPTYAYLVDYTAPQGLHKPEVVYDFGDENEDSNYGEVVLLTDDIPLYMLRVERLQKVDRKNADFKAYSKAMKKMWRPHDGTLDMSKVPDEEWEAMPILIKDFIEDMDTFLTNYHCMLDGAIDRNVMQRANGEIVFNDPVFDRDIYAELGRAKAMARKQRYQIQQYGYAY